MKFPKKAAVGALTGMLLLGDVNSSQAAETTTTAAASDPGPAGDFSWEGYNWHKRFWDGGPHFNRDYDAANVASPDANGYVKLNLTNPTGNAPVAAEFQTTRRGFGYGTYSTVVEKNVAALQKEVVWGCLFTYDPDAMPGHSEIDLCEASAWGGGAEWGESWPVEQGHGYWFDATKPPGQGNNTISFAASSSPILTHKMVWEPGKITFETYSGEGYAGPLLKRTVLQGDTVPVPAREHVVFNLWVTGGGGGKPQQVKPEQVIVRDFNFTPAGSNPSFPSCSNLKVGDAWAGVGTYCGLGAAQTGKVASQSVTTPTSTATEPTSEPTATSSPSPVATSSPMETATAAPSPSITPTTSPSVSSTTTAPTVAPSAPLSASIEAIASTVKVQSVYNTTVKWTGAVGDTVKVIANGGTFSVPTGNNFTMSSNKGTTTTYQVCDSAGCSGKITVKT